MRFTKFIAAFIICCYFSCGLSDDDVIGNPDPAPIDQITSAPCENGFAGPFPCNGYDLMGNISVADMGASGANDIWGWTDSNTGREYAIIGLDNGTAFIDITNAQTPVLLGRLATATFNSVWRDIKVHNNYAFIVSEAPNHGMQVFNLERLRDVTNPPVDFTADNRFTGFGNAHNIVINETSGYAYAVGTSRGDAFNGGAHFIDISNPANPLANGGFASEGYTHDAQVITYSGPDNRYTGKEIFLGSNENRLVIADITDKANPELISSINYANRAYTHQGWFTENQQYFLLGDEIDELNFGFNSRTIIFDLTDLENPVVHHEYIGPTPAIDHNGYVRGNEFFLANYTAGIRIINIADIANKNLVETGFFDTYPQSNSANMTGAWSVYPYFSSGNIIISDTENGLFIIKKSD